MSSSSKTKYCGMSPHQIKEIQDKLLDLIVYFDTFCKENGIEYYLEGGSALGAIRHQDFIPWDDDFDVLLTQENYEKLLQLSQTSKFDNSIFYMQSENSEEWPCYYSKLRMNGTTYIEENTKHNNMHNGFFIDIFCLYNVSSNKFVRYTQYLAARFLVAKSLAKKGYNTKTLKKRFVMYLSNLFINKYLEEKLFGVVNQYRNCETEFIGNLFTRGNFKRNCYPKYYMGKPRLVKFGKLRLPVGEYVEHFLKLLFGDYMKMPDEKTRSKYPSHVTFFDTEVDYKEYAGKKF